MTISDTTQRKFMWLPIVVTGFWLSVASVGTALQQDAGGGLTAFIRLVLIASSATAVWAVFTGRYFLGLIVVLFFLGLDFGAVRLRLQAEPFTAEIGIAGLALVMLSIVFGFAARKRR